MRSFVEGTILHGGLNLLQTILLDTTPGDGKERLVKTMQRSNRSSYIPLAEFEGILGEADDARRQGQAPRCPSAGTTPTGRRWPGQ